MVSCLGVFAYLRRGTVRRVFEAVAGLPRGSGIVFAFAPEKGLNNRNPEETASVAERAAELGEPWLTRFVMEDLMDELHACGFIEVSFLEPREAESRYHRNRSDLPVP